MIDIDFDIRQYQQDSYEYVSEFMDRFNLKTVELDADEELRVCFIGITEPITIGLNKEQCKDFTSMTIYTMLRNIPTGFILRQRVLVEECKE